MISNTIPRKNMYNKNIATASDRRFRRCLTSVGMIKIEAAKEAAIKIPPTTSKIYDSCASMIYTNSDLGALGFSPAYCKLFW